jgi:hypothetical protein
MFRNPVMVNGFPIANNSNTGLGIEMPLNMMAELAGAAKAVEFQGKVVIKGFSTMLVATKLLGDMLVWHYLFNSNRDRISFLDIALEGTDDMSLLQLDNVRHVVGWSPDCMYNAGKRLQEMVDMNLSDNTWQVLQTPNTASEDQASRSLTLARFLRRSQ